MRTVANRAGQVRNLSWCILPAHWSGGQHVVGEASAQADAFDGFELPAVEVENAVSVPPGSLFTFDETQPNGAIIDAATTTGGMT